MNAALWAYDFFQKPFKNLFDPKLLNSILCTLTGLDILFIEISSHNVPIWTLKGEVYDFCDTVLYLNAKIMIVSKQVSQKQKLYMSNIVQSQVLKGPQSCSVHQPMNGLLSCHYTSMHFNIRIITHFTFTVK